MSDRWIVTTHGYRRHKTWQSAATESERLAAKQIAELEARCAELVEALEYAATALPAGDILRPRFLRLVESGKLAGHASDCATNNVPALPVGPCDCGA